MSRDDSARPEGQQVAWVVEFHDEFVPEFEAMSQDAQDGLLAVASAVERLGPRAGRPHVDTLVGSRHSNMKELRFKAHGGREEWRAAFAFDPGPKAIVLVAGAKQGVREANFYRKLIAKADRRFGEYLAGIGGGAQGNARRS